MAKRPTKETDVPALAAVVAAQTAPGRSPSPFPVAGVGASAGGLRAFLELLRHLPEAPGLAIVFVLHQHKLSGADSDGTGLQAPARAPPQPLGRLQQNDGQGVDLLPCCAARHPDAHRAVLMDESPGQSNIFREADRVMLSRLSPAGVLINDSGDILQFRGRTSSFLEPPPGVASFDILKMAREGLLADLHAAIHAARKSDAPVRREGIQVR